MNWKILFKKRGSFFDENIGWWLLAIAVAVLVFFGVMEVLKPTGEGAMAFIKQKINFG